MQLQYVYLPDVLTAEDLLCRWPGMTEAQLAELVNSRHLLAFQRAQQHKDSDGKLVSACLPLSWLGADVGYDRTSTVFEADRVADFEKQRPQVKWPLVAPSPRPTQASKAPTSSFDTPLYKSVSLERLLWFWPGTTEEEIFRLVSERKLPAYLCQGTDGEQVDSAGRKLFMCARNGLPHVPAGSTKRCWDFVRFAYHDVIAFECEHPEFRAEPTLPLLEDDEDSSGEQPPKSIRVQELLERWPGVPSAEVWHMLDVGTLPQQFSDDENVRVELQAVESMEARNPDFTRPPDPLVTIETIQDRPDQVPYMTSVPTVPRKVQAKAQQPKKRGEITAGKAAEHCGVTERTIQNWDKGRGMPKGYPGRANTAVLIIWAEGYKQSKFLERTGAAIEDATPMSPQDMDKLDTRKYQSVFEDN